jgi:peroxisomal enoyl-CoA hydratase 2
MFKGDDADVNDFKKRVGGSTAKGLPKFDPNRGVSAISHPIRAER